MRWGPTSARKTSKQLLRCRTAAGAARLAPAPEVQQVLLLYIRCTQIKCHWWPWRTTAHGILTNLSSAHEHFAINQVAFKNPMTIHVHTQQQKCCVNCSTQQMIGFLIVNLPMDAYFGYSLPALHQATQAQIGQVHVLVTRDELAVSQMPGPCAGCLLTSHA